MNCSFVVHVKDVLSLKPAFFSVPGMYTLVVISRVSQHVGLIVSLSRDSDISVHH